MFPLDAFHAHILRVRWRGPRDRLQCGAAARLAQLREHGQPRHVRGRGSAAARGGPLRGEHSAFDRESGIGSAEAAVLGAVTSTSGRGGWEPHVHPQQHGGRPPHCQEGLHSRAGKLGGGLCPLDAEYNSFAQRQLCGGRTFPDMVSGQDGAKFSAPLVIYVINDAGIIVIFWRRRGEKMKLRKLGEVIYIQSCDKTVADRKY